MFGQPEARDQAGNHCADKNVAAPPRLLERSGAGIRVRASRLRGADCANRAAPVRADAPPPASPQCLAVPRSAPQGQCLKYRDEHFGVDGTGLVNIVAHDHHERRPV